MEWITTHTYIRIFSVRIHLCDFFLLVYVIFIIRKRNNHISSIFFFQRPCQHLMQRWIDVRTLPFVPCYLGIFPYICLFSFLSLHRIISYSFVFACLFFFCHRRCQFEFITAYTEMISRNDSMQANHTDKMVLLLVLPWI